jgi:molybdate transport system substrate-binding protein
MGFQKILSLAAAAAALAVSTTAVAQNAPLNVIASNGMRAVIDELAPQAERELGRKLANDFSTTAAQRQRIEKGDAFDAVVLTTEALDALAKAGKVAPDSVTPLGRSGVGVGVRAGAAKPDVGSPEALKRALLAVKSVTWVSVGASKPIIEKMLDTFGIAAEMKPKIVLSQSVDESLEAVASGKTDMVLTLTSEILPSHGVQYVGPLPASVQGYVSFSAGVSAATAARADAAKLVAALRAPAARAAYEAKGMEQSR